MTLNFSANLPAIKDNLVRQFRSAPCLRDINLSRLQESESTCGLRFALEDIAVDVSIKNIEESDNLQLECLNKLRLGRFMPLAFEQICSKMDKKKNEIMITLSKILSVKDTDSEVLKIKRELIEDYGVESVYFDNQPDIAKKWLDTAKILKQNNLPLPNEIICTKYLLGSYLSPYCMTLVHSNENHTVIINPTLFGPNSDDLQYASTDNPLHILVHECVHCIQPHLLSFQLKKIPAKFKDVAYNLSEYAKDNCASEIHAELLTKKILAKLEPREEELLQYLGGTWFA